MRRLVLLLGVVAALVGCGGGEDSAGPRALTLALDFTPNAVHAPLFAAAADNDRDVAIDIQAPGSGPDALKLVASGRAQLGVLDIHDLAIARAEGADLVAVAGLVQKPLAALAAQPDVERPRDLEGRRVGVSGLPSDPAFLDAMVADDGGDPERVDQITIGFNAVTRLLSGRVDAAPVFWNAEGVALRRAGLQPKLFRVDDYGAPPYPEVVLVTSEATLAEDRALLADAVAAIGDGIEDVRADPDAAVATIADAAQASDRGLVRAQLDAVSPLFGTGLDEQVLREWAAFDARIGIVGEPPDVDAAFQPVGKD